MPFRLKNTRAAYQRSMKPIFHDMVHITMEDYVDDILEKSITRKDHLIIFRKIFSRLEEYNL
jgi:hypothetical protein